MGCGCGVGKSKVNGRACQGKVNILQTTRNRLISLGRLATTDEKVLEYKNQQNNLEEIIKDSVKTCPDMATVNLLKQYVDNEYTNYL